MCVRLIVVGVVQDPAEERADAEDAEVRAGDDLGAQRLRAIAERDVHRGRRAREDAVEDVGLIAQIAIERVRHQVDAAPPLADERAAPVEQDEAIGLAHGQ